MVSSTCAGGAAGAGAPQMTPLFTTLDNYLNMLESPHSDAQVPPMGISSVMWPDAATQHQHFHLLTTALRNLITARGTGHLTPELQELLRQAENQPPPPPPSTPPTFAQALEDAPLYDREPAPVNVPYPFVPLTVPVIFDLLQRSQSWLSGPFLQELHHGLEVLTAVSRQDPASSSNAEQLSGQLQAISSTLHAAAALIIDLARAAHATGLALSGSPMALAANSAAAITPQVG